MNKISIDVGLVLIRLLPSAAKLIFLIYLSGIDGGSLVGEYALIASGLALYVAFVGFEINAEVSRIVHSINKPRWKLNVLSSFSTVIIILNLLFVVTAVVFVNYLPEVFKSFFGLILLWYVTEHVAAEIFRVLIILNRRISATFFLFGRVVPALLLPLLFDWFKYISINIEVIAISSICLNILSIIVIFYLYDLIGKASDFISFTHSKEGVFEVLAIVGGLFSGAKFYYAVALFGALGANLDKFLINEVIGINEAGKYFVLSSIAGIYSLMISFTVGMRQAPELLVSYGNDSINVFLDKYHNATRVLFALSIPILLLVFLSYFIVAEFFKNELKNYYVEFGIVALGFFVSSFSTLNRSILLLVRAERMMFIANTIPSIFFLFGIYLVGERIELIGVCILFTASSLFSLILFSYFSSRVERLIGDVRGVAF